MATQQEIALKLKRRVFGEVNTALVRRAALIVARKALSLQKERIVAGLDRNSRRFGNYTAPYNQFKKSFLGRGSSKKKKSRSRKTINRLRGRRTGNAATKLKDYLRLTGELWDDMVYKVKNVTVTGSGISIKIVLTVKPRSKLKAEGLERTTGRNRYTSYSKKAFRFLGLAVSGSRKAIEEKALIQTAVRALFGLAAKSGASVNKKTGTV